MMMKKMMMMMMKLGNLTYVLNFVLMESLLYYFFIPPYLKMYSKSKNNVHQT